MPDKAYINPLILKWARESAKVSLETAAAKFSSVTPERVAEWEEGKEYPTINQAGTLAKLYKRPFAWLFLQEVPADFLPLQDFRRKDARALGTASTFIIREIQQKQAWMKDILETEEADPLPFVGRFSLQDDASVVTNEIFLYR
ncbi:helix-turn-helix domain-containing protein [Terrimonas sp. NA20]|uniref:Helix-turn-helix domain-containing protein n=1 Tax=Terrimonas ginsenosidimutans TaxID=2908004 RepID=A0ABS9L0N9_9BACT|nr:helix-turn-helix transcriptional regulator [Terrimonas ginsenosidimutans]MCG2618125.1 helix-turn-helix domain-containing protein [Terrimonas ginsenosidimutans]